MSCASCRLNLVLDELLVHKDVELTNLQLTKENLNELMRNPFRSILKKMILLGIVNAREIKYGRIISY
ncbi:hypothetical protein AWV80_16325 [Cupriavidus sp. UYMU48A]|nr:hypothetical protein AWV80_16325 [Cupriavidus sp. UYMU48A]